MKHSYVIPSWFSPLSYILMRDRAAVARQPHKLKVVGSNPTPAIRASDEAQSSRRL